MPLAVKVFKTAFTFVFSRLLMCLSDIGCYNIGETNMLTIIIPNPPQSKERNAQNRQNNGHNSTWIQNTLFTGHISINKQL